MVKPIPNYPDYMIYDDGRVWSNKTNKFLKPSPTSRGYLTVELFNNSGSKRLLIHRLVASAFIPNPHNLPQVNHKDEVKSHNYVNNLEWSDSMYNANYGTRNERIKKAHSKKIYCKELDRIFNSQKEAAAELGLDQGNISRVCRGKANTTGGFHFEFIIEE